MTTPRTVAWLITLSVALALVLPVSLKYRGVVLARETAARNSAASERLHADVAHVLKTLPAWVLTGPPVRSGPLAQTFTTAMTAAGLDASTVEAFTPSVSNVVHALPNTKDGPVIVRDRASAVLAGVSLPQLGRALESWRAAAPSWTVTHIDLSPQRLGPAEAAKYAGSDLPLRVTLTIERLSATNLEKKMGGWTGQPVPPKDRPQ